MKKEIEKIKVLMMQSLEEIDASGVLRGDFLCHEDIPEHLPEGMDDYFTVVGDDEKVAYVVLIKEVKI